MRPGAYVPLDSRGTHKCHHRDVADKITCACGRPFGDRTSFFRVREGGLEEAQRKVPTQRRGKLRKMEVKKMWNVAYKIVIRCTRVFGVQVVLVPTKNTTRFSTTPSCSATQCCVFLKVRVLSLSPSTKRFVV